MWMCRYDMCREATRTRQSRRECHRMIFWVGRGRRGMDGSILQAGRRKNNSIASLPYPHSTQQTSANKCCGLPSLKKIKIISTNTACLFQIFAAPRTGEKERKRFLQGLLTHCMALRMRVRQCCRQKRKKRKQGRKKEKND